MPKASIVRKKTSSKCGTPAGERLAALEGGDESFSWGHEGSFWLELYSDGPYLLAADRQAERVFALNRQLGLRLLVQVGEPMPARWAGRCEASR